MFLKTFPVGAFQCNCTIIGDEKTNEAIVIDPGDEASKILNELNKQSLTVKYILHTHAHIDHIGATKTVKQHTQGKIGLHRDDLFLYENLKMQSDLLGMKVDPQTSPIDHYLVDADDLTWGTDLHCEVIHTPGHTPGSLTFALKSPDSMQSLLLTGDTLFMGSIGRTDLWGGDYDQIIASIKEKLLPFQEATVVIPGHGPKTSIGQEKRINPFIRS